MNTTATDHHWNDLDDSRLDYLIDKALTEQINQIPPEYTATRKYLAKFRTQHICTVD